MTSLRRGTLICLAVACIAILGALKVEGFGDSDKWMRLDADEEIEFQFASMRLYQAAYALAFGPGEITGTYQLWSTTEPRRETGRFMLITDEKGYVTAYALVAKDGRVRQLRNDFCWFLTDDAGKTWAPRSNSATRISRGLVAEIAASL